MVRAAARGVIDFRRADFRDPNWWLRRKVLIEEMERWDEFELWKLITQRHLGLIHGRVSDQAFSELQKGASQAILAAIACLRPWDRPDLQKLGHDAEQLREAYVREIGDPRDPELIQRILDAMHSQEPQRVPDGYLSAVTETLADA